MHTKNYVKVSALIALLLFGLVPVAMAGQIKIDRITDYYSGNGGEFNITGIGTGGNVAAASYNGGFETFCLEKDEFVTIPGFYNYAFSKEAYAGGNNTDSGDPISAGTAYLYYHFAKETLSGYNYTPGGGRVASAGVLQEAIWFLEKEITSLSGGSNAFVNLAITQFGTLAKAMEDANGMFGVRVINLTTSTGQLAQDQLYLPEPGTLLLLGMGFLGLATFRRSRK